MVDELFSARKREEDLLQLAHYQRMLEAAGLAAADGRWGGIVGTEARVVWYDLDAPMWTTPSSTGKQKVRTTMERYDFEFDFRLDVIAVAQAHLNDPSVDLLVVPAAIAECPECPWRDYCRERIEAGSGDVEPDPEGRLAPTPGPRCQGSSRPRRARSPRHSNGASRRRRRERCRDAVAHRRPSPGNPRRRPECGHPLEETADGPAGRRHPNIRRPCSLASQHRRILRCRAVNAPRADRPCPRCTRAGADLPTPRRRTRSTVPRADIEVDIDMENIESGVYIWGTLLTDRTGATPSPVYKAFATWEPLDAEAGGRQLAPLLGVAHRAQTRPQRATAARSVPTATTPPPKTPTSTGLDWPAESSTRSRHS